MTMPKPATRHGIDCIGYTGVSLDDIYRYLKELRESTETLIKELTEYKSQVIQNKKNIDDTDSIILFIDLSVELFSRFLYDCDRLLDEIPNEVKDFHIDMLNEMIELSKFRNKECFYFKCNHIIKHLRDESIRPLLDDIYSNTSYGFEAYIVLGGVSPRLKTYIGAKLIHKSEKKANSVAAKIVPFPTPSDARWHELKISFIDNETVQIKIRDIIEPRKYNEMGFKDNKSRYGKPTKYWNFLKEFAMLKGHYTNYPINKKVEIEKDVSVLRNLLRKYFKIPGDPISYIGNYKKGRNNSEYNGYKANFKIEHSQNTREYEDSIRKQYSRRNNTKGNNYNDEFEEGNYDSETELE